MKELYTKYFNTYTLRKGADCGPEGSQILWKITISFISFLQRSSQRSQSCRETEPWAPAASEKCIYWSADAWKEAKKKKCKEQRRQRRAWNSFGRVSEGPEVCVGSRHWGHMGSEILWWGKQSSNKEMSVQHIMFNYTTYTSQCAMNVFRMASMWWCGPNESFHIQVDISGTGQVKWQQLCSYLLLEYTERELASIPRAALHGSQQQLRHCSHSKVGLISCPERPIGGTKNRLHPFERQELSKQ